MDPNGCPETMYPEVYAKLSEIEPVKKMSKSKSLINTLSFGLLDNDDKEKPKEVAPVINAPKEPEPSDTACPDAMYPSVYDKLSQPDKPKKVQRKKSMLNAITFGLLDNEDDDEPKEKKGEKKESFIDSLFSSKKEDANTTVTAPEEAIVSTADPKDTEDFTYENYTALPEFTSDHKSLMSKLLSKELFEQLKDKKTATGYTLSNAIQTGVKTPHLGVGITAGDEESWEMFKDIMYPVIKGWHGFDPAKDTHKVDLDASKLVFSEETCALFDNYVVSTRIRAARNVSGFALPAGALAEDRAGVEKVLTEAFNKFDGELSGKYHPLGDLNEEDTEMLLTNGFLFQKPKDTNLLWHAGAARSWPDNRGIFYNNEKTALCWVNEEDHCRIISMANGGDVKKVFARFATISDALQEAATNNGTKLMFSEKLGFLGTCPSNLGTGLRGSVMIKLPKLNEDPEFLELVCDKFNLQPRGSSGEHSAAKGAKWDISNKQRIGFSEVELVQKMIDGVTLIIRIEEILAEGSKTKEEITKLLDTPDELLNVEEVVLETPDISTAKKGCCTIA